MTNGEARTGSDLLLSEAMRNLLNQEKQLS
jgi:hypothetical protein